MEKRFENIQELHTSGDYDGAMSYVEDLINEATLNGFLDSQDADNEYTREIGRVGHLCAEYENNKMIFQTLTVNGRSPLVRTLQQEMTKRDIKQKEMAKMIGINDTVFSLFMNGRRHLSMNSARQLYKKMNIDPKLILEYA